MDGYEFRPLTADDMEQLLDLRHVAFGPIGDRERAARVLTARLPYSLGAFKAGRLRSASAMLPLSANLAGREFTLGGVSGVATSPESRRAGLVAECLRHWYANLRERGLGWSAEHPFEPSFYARYGYQTVLNGHSVELPLSELAGAARALAVPAFDAERVSVADADRLKGIHEAFAKRFSFFLTRQDEAKDHWPGVFQRPWESAPRTAFLMEDAYAILTTEDDPAESGRSKLELQDFAYSSPAGRGRLLSLLARFEGQCTTARLHLPPGDAIALDRAAFRTAQAAELQLRIVDLAAALELLPWPGEALVRLRVRDDDCPWNDGVFEIELAPTGVSVRRSGDEPEAALDIAALTALVVGAASAETLVADGRASGSPEALRKLGGTLSGHPIFKLDSDHF